MTDEGGSDDGDAAPVTIRPQQTPGDGSLFAVRVSVTAPWRFFPRKWWRYWRPRRITASFRERHIYRWLVFNIAPKGWP